MLACQTEIHDNLEVWVPPEARLEEEQVLTTESTIDYRKPQEIEKDATLPAPSVLYMPLTQKLFLSPPEPTLADNASDLDRIQREIRKNVKLPDIETSFASLKGLASMLRENNWQVTATLYPKNEHCPQIIFSFG